MAYDILEPEPKGYDVLEPETPNARGYDVLEPEIPKSPEELFRDSAAGLDAALKVTGQAVGAWDIGRRSMEASQAERDPRNIAPWMFPGESSSLEPEQPSQPSRLPIPASSPFEHVMRARANRPPDLLPSQGNEQILEPKQPDVFDRLLSETAIAPVGIGKFTRGDAGQLTAPRFQYTPANVESENKAVTVPTQVSAAIGLLPEGALKDLSAGAYNAMAGLVNFFLSPQGAAVSGIYGAGAASLRTRLILEPAQLGTWRAQAMRQLIDSAVPAAKRGLSAGFAYQMATAAPEQLQAGDEAYKSGDLAKAMEGWLGGAGSVGFAALAGSHAAFGGVHPLAKPDEWQTGKEPLPDNIPQARQSTQSQAPAEASQPSRLLGLDDKTPGETVATPATPGASPGRPGLVRSALDELQAQQRADAAAAQAPAQAPKTKLQTPTPDTTPATKEDLAKLADFIQNGGNNPFAPTKPAEAAPTPAPTNLPPPVTGPQTVKQPVTPSVVPGGGVVSPEQTNNEQPPVVHGSNEVAAPEKWQPVKGNDVVFLHNARSPGKLATVVQVQEDGGAKVYIKGDGVYVDARPDQLRPTRKEINQKLRADELAEAGDPVKVERDAKEFANLVEEYAPQLGLVDAQAYEDAALRGDGIANEKLRVRARENLARAAGVEGYQDNMPTERAKALPKLEAYLKAQFPNDNSIAKRRALADFARSETPAPTAAEQSARAKQDEAHLRRIAAQNPGDNELQGLTLHNPIRGASGPAGQLHGHTSRRVISAAEQQLLRELDRQQGTHTIIVDSPGEDLPFNGWKDRRSNVILIHARTPLPLLQVAGHEISHHIMLAHPGLYADMYDDLSKLIPPEQLERFKERLRARGQSTADRNAYVELIGDFFGDQFGRKSFWDDLKQRAPELFRRLARIVKAWLDKLLAKLKVAHPKGFESEQYFSDLEKARNMVANALIEAAERTVTGNTKTQTPNTIEASNGTITGPGLVDIGGPGGDFSITAHHGTPHKVDRFSTAKIGTGEGAQVYGWGLYFAELDAVAEQYQKNLAGLYNTDARSRDGKRLPLWVARTLEAGRVAEVKKDFEARHKEAIANGNDVQIQGTKEVLEGIKAFENGERFVTGYKYTVSLNVEPEDLLDWDKPLSEQSEKVKAALLPFVQSEAQKQGTNALDAVGNGIYNRLASREEYADLTNVADGRKKRMLVKASSPRAASKHLASLGIKGIRYADQFTRVADPKHRAEYEQRLATARANLKDWQANLARAKTPTERSIAEYQIQNHQKDIAHYTELMGKTVKSTYNYVIFDENDITITHENGQAVSAGQMFSKPEGERGDLFGLDAPESVAEQKARLAREANAKIEAAKLAEKKALVARGGDKLTGKDLDTTREMFGAEVRQDKAGQGSLFSKPDTGTGDLFSYQPATVSAPDKAVEIPRASKKLSDFGEKLGWARKDLASSLKRDISDSDLAGMSLSEIWPKSEVDEIQDLRTAALASAVRSIIPAKPRQSYKLSRWVETVKMVKELMRIAQERGVDEVMARMREDRYKLAKFADKVDVLSVVDRSQWERIGDVANHPDAYRYGENGEKIKSPFASSSIDGRNVSAANLPELTEKIKAALGSPAPAQKMAFEVRGTESRGFGINKKGDPLYRRLKTFPTVREALDYARNHNADLVAAWEAVKATDNVKETDVRRGDNRPRVGGDHRAGRDATPEMFLNTFGFRGVEFGNWVAQGANNKERQGMLNASYDALMDLASVVGVPPRALALNGTLGLGLGSRGHGWASAHYEPDTLVINLTKTRGAGTLAHEWFHALDNYFQRYRNERGIQNNAGDYITQQPESYYENASGHRLSRSRFQEIQKYGRIKPEDWKLVEGVRPEVSAAFTDLVKALDASPMNERASLIDKGKSDGYWSRIIERAARSFENYVIGKMQLMGYHNDYLANIVNVEDFARDKDRYPYLLPDELKPVSDAFDGLFSTIKTRETEKGLALFSKPDDSAPPAYAELQAKAKETSDALAEAVRQHGNPALRPADQKPGEALKAKHLAAAAHRQAREALLSHPDYIRDLLTQAKELAQAGRVASDAGNADQAQEIQRHFEDTLAEIEQAPKKLVDQISAEMMKNRPARGLPDLDPSQAQAAAAGEETAPDTFVERRKRALARLPLAARDWFTNMRKAKDQLAARIATAPLKELMAADFDSGETRAMQFGKQASNLVLHELNRAFGATGDRVAARNPTREAALTFFIEGGGTMEGLQEARELIVGSQHNRGKWADEALRAIKYAEQHFNRLAPVAQLYAALTDNQVLTENESGVSTIHREGGYVFHLQDILSQWAHGDLLAGSSGGGVAAPFKHIREHPTYAQALANGVNPRTLNAVDLLQKRLALGNKLVNARAWVQGMRRLVDPATQTPIITDTITKIKRNGETDTTAPPGYKVVSYAGHNVAIHSGYEGVFDALTAESKITKRTGGALAMNVAATTKHLTLLIDTYHLGRMAFWAAMVRGMSESGPGMFLPGAGWKYAKGLTLLDNTRQDIEEAARRGEIPQVWTKELVENKRLLDLLIRSNLHVGTTADNIFDQSVLHNLPVFSDFNHFLFQKFVRGAMAEAALIEFKRQKKMNPTVAEADLARRVSRDLNIRFGNLKSASWIKGRTFQDLARLLFLAPQWNESLIRSELGAVRDILKAPGDSFKSGRVNIGPLGRAVFGALFGTFLFNQIINFITRGTPTWENPEEGMGAKLSAWIPDLVGDGPGFFLNPLTLPAEIAELLAKKTERSGDFTKAVHEYGMGRLSLPGRAAATFATRKDWTGASLRDGKEVAGEMLSNLVPVPMSAGAMYGVGKELVTGEKAEKFPGQFQRQAFQTFGIKLDSAPSADQRMRSLATKFNREADVKPGAEFFHGDYYDLDRALRIGNQTDLKQSLAAVLEKKTPEDVRKHYTRWANAPFTGQVARERDFVKTLNTEQRATYDKARVKRQELRAEVLKLLK